MLPVGALGVGDSPSSELQGWGQGMGRVHQAAAGSHRALLGCRVRAGWGGPTAAFALAPAGGAGLGTGCLRGSGQRRQGAGRQHGGG